MKKITATSIALVAFGLLIGGAFLLGGPNVFSNALNKLKFPDTSKKIENPHKELSAIKQTEEEKEIKSAVDVVKEKIAEPKIEVEEPIKVVEAPKPIEPEVIPPSKAQSREEVEYNRPPTFGDDGRTGTGIWCVTPWSVRELQKGESQCN